VSLPPILLPALAAHLVEFVPDDPDALVFTGPSVHRPPLRRNNFRKLARWERAVAAVGAPGLHFHDLRHAGNSLTANAGANLRELMERMGHSTTRAALIYLHSTDERQRTIADLIDKRARTELRKIKKPAKSRTQSGTEVARRRGQAS
jgi:integrase